MWAQFFNLKQNKKGLHATNNNASAWKLFLKPLKTWMRIMCMYTLKLQVPCVDFLIPPTLNWLV
jgi:hypothetical protein